MTRFDVLAAVLFASAAPARAQTEVTALGLERRLDGISADLEEKRQRLLSTTAHLALIDMKEATRIWNDRSAEMAPTELKVALLAEQLQRYKETGVLSPTPPETAERIERLLKNSWSLPSSEPDVPKLDLDLAKLQKQLRRYEDAGRRPRTGESVKPPRPATQNLPAPAARLEPPSMKVETRRPKFERDAGTGSPERDPIPGLIALLSSAEPRGRALAADELGNSGAAAAPAVPALKRALADPDRRVRASAALALGAVARPDPDVLTGLRRALNDGDEEVRLSARTALDRLERP